MLPLVPDDTNQTSDMFVVDRDPNGDGLDGPDRGFQRASVGMGGVQGGGSNAPGMISADGRHVAFRSTSSNLVPGDLNLVSDVFVHDLFTGTTTRVSVDSGGNEIPLRASAFPAISADGRFVAFHTNAAFDPADTAITDIYTHDRDPLEDGFDGPDLSTQLVSITTDGQQRLGTNAFAAISDDGRFVTWDTHDPLVSPGILDTNRRRDVYVHDTQTGITDRVSFNVPSGVQGNNDSFLAEISGDGRSVAFVSTATNLVANDTNRVADVFVAPNPLAQGLLTVTPSTFDFGSVCLGLQPSQQVAFANNNSFSVTVDVGNIVTSGDTADFSITPVTLPPGFPVIGPGEQAVLDIVFAPMSAGPKMWSLQIPVLEAPGLFSIFTATATALPSIAINPDPVDFGSVVIGLTATQNVVVQNVCSTGDSITVTSITTTAPFDAAPTAALPIVLAPMATTPLQAMFSPTAEGSFTDILQIGLNNISSQSFNLAGQGFSLFQVGVPYSAGDSPHTVTIHDFDGDDVADIAVGNPITSSMVQNSIGLLLGNGTVGMPAIGDGTFSLSSVSVLPGTGFFVRGFAAGDFTGDGNIDVAISPDAPAGGISIVSGTGAGGFGAITTLSSGNTPHSLATGTFDNNAMLDLASANIGSNTVSIFLNAGGGTFLPRTDYIVGSMPAYLTAERYNSNLQARDPLPLLLNGDSLTDLVVANAGDGTISVLLACGVGTVVAACAGSGNVPGTFVVLPPVAVGGMPISIEAAEFDAVPGVDLAVLLTNVSNDSEVHLLSGNGDGTFTAGPVSAVGSGPVVMPGPDFAGKYMATGDFDRDGILDLIVSRSFVDLRVMKGDEIAGIPTGGFTPYQDLTSYAPSGPLGPSFIEVGDFNEDGFADVVTAQEVAPFVTVFIGQ